jgi:hypothetical protein
MNELDESDGLSELADLSLMPVAFMARRRAIPMAVEFASGAGTLKTREGDVAFDIGDAIVTGVENERCLLLVTVLLRPMFQCVPLRLVSLVCMPENL